jgi:hypothetical protein
MGLISFLFFLSWKAQAFSPKEFHCKGTVVENGTRRSLNASSKFEITSWSSPLSEISFDFQKMPQNRMNLQIRALALPEGLNVAATFIEIATEPLGEAESVFFEKIHPTENLFKIEKTFETLQFKITCEASD